MAAIVNPTHDSARVGRNSAGYVVYAALRSLTCWLCGARIRAGARFIRKRDKQGSNRPFCLRCPAGAHYDNIPRQIAWKKQRTS